MNKDEKLKIGIVGTSGMGMEHIEYILKCGCFEITSLCDLNNDNLNKAFNYINERQTVKPEKFTVYDEMLAKGGFEGICAAVPIPLNAEIACKGLDAGYHVLSEKPTAVNLEEAARLKKSVDSSDKVYQVGFELRFSPLATTLMEVIKRGDIGKVCGITYNYARRPDHSHRGGWAKHKEGGSVLFDCLSHSFDLINLFALSEMEKVSAFCSKESDLVFDVPDIGSIAIKYKNGVHATLFFCEFCDQPNYTTFQIFGDDGKILVDPANAGEFKMFWGKGKHSTTVSINPESAAGSGHIGIGEEHAEFRNAIAEGRNSFADFKVGLDSLFLSIGSTRSFEENRIVTARELEEEFQKY